MSAYLLPVFFSSYITEYHLHQSYHHAASVRRWRRGPVSSACARRLRGSPSWGRPAPPGTSCRRGPRALRARRSASLGTPRLRRETGPARSCLDSVMHILYLLFIMNYFLLLLLSPIFLVYFSGQMWYPIFLYLYMPTEFDLIACELCQ